MPTTNVTVGRTWVKLADASQAFLISANFDAVLEIATTSADSAPTVDGHKLRVGVGENALTRDVIGAGYVWARITDYKSGLVVVTK